MSGFHQIPLEQSSRKYTSFSTEKGAFQFTRLPFGLNISPNSFSRMMSIAFTGLTPEKAFLYMDDIVVIGITEKHHLDNLKKTFEICRAQSKKKAERAEYRETEEEITLQHKTHKQTVRKVLNNMEAHRLPILSFGANRVSPRLSTRVKNKIKCSKSMTTGFNHFDLGQLLVQLDQLAVENAISKAKIYVNDIIFKLCTIDEFINEGNKILKNVDIYICEVPEIIEDDQEKLRIIEEYHNHPMFGGHVGNNRLVKKLKARFRWKNMEKDIRKYIKHCHKCEINKPKRLHVEEFVISDTSSKPWDIVYIDTSRGQMRVLAAPFVYPPPLLYPPPMVR
ncbi:uncharacterized protein [Diabrotica undecimpunctata]|uniref:uncharacterized protein n=1 Tax=Diabrotica undecimpunctata TaxID=50387 RepID=UPI003B638BE0